ncbi:hypothetical protein RQM59_05700 [Flavobacteriaceae bacterium S356]|uniref:Macroglobulin domain-containing protein n=1 Tax=Asprobacillus argus TaxID=3076534 RepID=A0ABU3LFA7_9FLAO|nr:hypothetical protein [Flavobacteriaceae bacterium S356]
MKSLTTLNILFLFIVQVTFGQKDISEIRTAYANYFQDTREIPFLHINKTSFLNGEEIWFKAYVVEQNSMKLHPATTNLYVSVFDESGVLKQQQLVHIQQGKGRGSILIDSTFTQRNYYLKASTKWMKNFKEDQSFSQKINIVSSQEEARSALKFENDFFKLNVFPEGGQLVANSINNVGILVKDSNNERQKIVKGLIKDRKGILVKRFLTNDLGLGSVRLFFKEQEQYTFEAELENGSVITEKIAAIPSSRIALRVENKKKYLVVHLHTNRTYLEKNTDKQFKVWVHNTKQFLEYDLTLNSDMQNYALIIKKNGLPSGINIVTVFDDENAPIAERLVFINRGNLYSSVAIKAKKQSDSISFTFTNSTNEKLFLSASFLPTGTRAYNPKNSIISSVLLKPFVISQIDHEVHSYLGKDDLNNQSLDLSLISKGWSKYNWNTILTNSPELNHDFEQGIDMTIRLNKNLAKKQKLLIFSADNNLLHEVTQKSIPFIIRNTSIKKNTEINFGIKRGDRMSEITPPITYSNHQLYDSFKDFEKSDILNEMEVSIFPTLTSDVERLDEVVVKAEKSEVPWMSRRMRRIDPKDITIQSGTLLDYLKLKIPPNRPYSLFVDGELQRGIFRYDALTSTNIDEIKEIYMGTSLVFSPDPFAIDIHVYTFSPLEIMRKRNKYSTLKIPVGFSLEKEYYYLKYPRSNNRYFKYYAALFWEPDIIIEPNASVTLTMLSCLQDNMNICVEGISESGKLVSQRKTIKILP